MLDINLIRNNPQLVKENIKKKYQEHKLALVDEVFVLDKKRREMQTAADKLRQRRNEISEQIGTLFRSDKAEEAKGLKEEVVKVNEQLSALENDETGIGIKIKGLMYQIPNIMDDTVPLGKDDSENVEIEIYGEPKEYPFEIPYHTDILEKLKGLDLDSSRRVSGSGFYYLTGDIARLHSAVLTYARDFMIAKGFTYVIPPFMIRSEVVEGVMSQTEKDEMMYKIEGEDLYLIGTSEHSMIGKFKDTIIDECELPLMLTSYSPCFRKEVGAHGIEERGIFRVHQFEKQEMIVICKPEESKQWFEKMYNYTIEFFRTLNMTVRSLECCSGDLADLKSKSIDIEGFSPRQKKYAAELGSCSNLTDAQARRLGIKIRGENEKYFAHTLNNTVVAPPRMLIPFIENNYNEDGSINIPEVLRPYMGGIDKIK